MNKNIWVYLEQTDGVLKSVGIELLGQARILADGLNQKVGAVIIGSNVKALAQDAFEYGADIVYYTEAAELDQYNTDVYTTAFCNAIKAHPPIAILIGASPNGRDLGPRIAGRMETGLCADCTELGIDEATNLIAWTRPAMGGNIMATILCPKHFPQMGTVRPNVFKKPERQSGRTGELVEIALGTADIRTKILEIIARGDSGVNIEDAEIIVAGGRGMQNETNFKLIEELAAVLGGTVGVSRAVVEAGWKPVQHQVGQTGKTVAPKIYFAFGISGAIQHLAGMTSADKIIAVNKDPDAPIFKVADYSVVADAMEFIPAFISSIKTQKA